jgi:hypothetical protein
LGVILKVRFLISFFILGSFLAADSWAEITNCRKCNQLSCLKENTYNDCVTAVDSDVCKESAANIKACLTAGKAAALKHKEYEEKKNKIIKEEMGNSAEPTHTNAS